MDNITGYKIRISTTSSRYVGEEYRYLQIGLPQELRDAANLRPEDKLSYRVLGSQVRIRYNPEGSLYRAGVISINERHLKHPVNLELDFELVDVAIDGDELVINVPDSAFIIKRGFDSIIKGFAGVHNG